MPYLVHTFEDFSAEHGDSYMHVGDRWIFADGAVWYGNQGTPPSADLHERTKCQLEYAMARAELLEHQAADLHEYIGTQAEWHAMGAGPAPPPTAMTELKRLRKDAAAAQRIVAELRRQLAMTPQSLKARSHEMQLQQSRAAAAAIMAELNRLGD